MFSGQSRIDEINVNYFGDTLHVEIEGIVPISQLPADELDVKLNTALGLFQEYLQQELGTPTTVEFNLIPVNMLNAHTGNEYLDPVGYKSPEERKAEALEEEYSENEVKLNN